MISKPICLVVLVIVGMTCTILDGQEREFSDTAVAGAISKAIDYLWSKQRADGSWVPYGGTDQYPYGPGALSIYALLAADESAQDPRMIKALDWLARGKTTKTYVLGLRSSVWHLANRKTNGKYRNLLKKDVDTIIRSTADGSYGYNCRGDGKSRGDNSNSQFGLLGVWAGARDGLEVPIQYWWKVMRHWLDTQQDDGGWTYRREEVDSTNTMTAAGLASMFVCFDNIFAASFKRCNLGEQGELVRRPMKRGLDWLDRNFSASGSYSHYYLYAIERVGLASGYKYFGKANWYQIGTKYLLRTQRGDGGWGGEVSTAFALLFLVRGQHSVLFNKLQYDGDWDNRPRDLANLTRWITRIFERTVNWQIINLKVPVREWHDAPILYISGAKAPKFTDADLAKLRQFVLEGGTIFSCTECSGSGFSKGMRDIYAKLFPKYEMESLPFTHPLYQIFFTLRRRPKFHMISNGIRPLVIHTDADLPKSWQMRNFSSERFAFEAAANVFMYTTDKGSLRNRGVTVWPLAPKFTPKRTIKIARLKYSGNYDPEPKAYERFARLMGRRYQIKIDAGDPIDIEKLGESDARLATLTGTGPFTFSQQQREAFEKFVTDGGTILIDAAGGAKRFAESAEKLLAKMYGLDAIVKLSSLSPLYRLDGMVIEKVKYRRATRQRLRKKQPNLKAVLVGNRVAVIFSREDLTAGLVGYPAYGCDGYQPDSAFEIVRNIAVYADSAVKTSTDQP